MKRRNTTKRITEWQQLIVRRVAKPYLVSMLYVSLANDWHFSNREVLVYWYQSNGNCINDKFWV